MRDAVGVLVRLGARVVSAEVGELGVRGEMGGLSYIVHALGERDASDVVWRGPRRGGSGQCTKYPHSEVESFHALLHQGHLADALPALVSVLHDTVPILEVLVHIPACAVPKAAGWWRAMFGPRGSTGGDVGAPSASRHALDFHVLMGSRVVVFDVSESLFCSVQPQPQDAQQSGSGAPVGFCPIPEFGHAIAEAVVAGRGCGTVAGV
jgi:hypothetical protein